MTTNPEANPCPESFIACDCGAVLGYRAQIDGVTFFYLYAYPARSVSAIFKNRRINGRVLSGDAHCPHCGAWTQLDLLRPWEKRLPK